MENFRNPVEGARMKAPLRCIDFAPDGSLLPIRRCQQEHLALKDGLRFKCPNIRAGNKRCERGAYLYPRRWSTHPRARYFHFHQGIDLGARIGTPILSVTSGRVCHVHRDWEPYQKNRDGTLKLDKNGDEIPNIGYGKTVGIYNEVRGKLYWYAHCESILVEEGQKVLERQEIATVGASGWVPVPHLHFEVAKVPKGVRQPLGGPTWEQDHSKKNGPREDPLQELADLGPWGVTSLADLRGKKPAPQQLLDLHISVETSARGGNFPLGANNTWHGGIHLPMLAEEKVHAPFDAEIVAARLDPDPDHAEGEFGHTNFILLRRELSKAVYDRMQALGDEPSSPEAPNEIEDDDEPVHGVGPGATNEADDVVAVKRKLSEHVNPKTGSPFWTGPIDATADAALTEAIRTYQRVALNYSRPDGRVDIPGKTWTELHDGSPPPEDDEPIQDDPAAPEEPEEELDPKRVVYCLLMHLAPKSAEDMVKVAPWLSRVKLSEQPDEPAPEEYDDEADAEEAKSHALTGSVGTDAANAPADVAWVQKRLRSLTDVYTFEGEASGTCDAELEAAIERFQAEKVWGAGHKNCDGVVSKRGKTYDALRKTRKELGNAPPPGKARVDPALPARLEERVDGVAKVLVNPGVTVSAGEVLWVAGEAAGFGPGGRELHPTVHWEFFSEEKLVADFEELVDENDDITVDAPKWLLNLVETPVATGEADFSVDGIVTPAEVSKFYAQGHGAFLRRYACKFRSEWAMDVSKAAAALKGKGWNTSALEAEMTPYLWWEEARDVLPPSPIVWHYNPIEFLAIYQEILGGFEVPVTPVPGSGDSPTPSKEELGTLVVRVFNAGGGRAEDVVVVLCDTEGTVKKTATSSKRDRRGSGGGEVVFPNLPVGAYEVRIEGVPMEPEPAPVLPNQINTSEIHTELPGPPPPTGTLKVKVWTHRKGPAKDVAIMVVETGEGTRTDGAGWASFELPYGTYQVAAGDAEAVRVTLEKPRTTTRVDLPAPIRTLRVVLQRNDRPAAGVKAVLMDLEKNRLEETTTDATGVAIFEIGEGRYRVGAEDRGPYYVHVGPHGATKEIVLSKTAPSSEPTAPLDSDEGVLVVHVSRGDEPGEGEVVVVLDAAGALVASKRCSNGVAQFALQPGQYEVAVEDRSTPARVSAGQDESVSFDLPDDDDDDDDEPTSSEEEQASATLQLTVITPKGPKPNAEVRARRAGAVRAKIETDADGAATLDVEPGKYQVYVQGAFSKRVNVDVGAGMFLPLLITLDR